MRQQTRICLLVAAFLGASAPAGRYTVSNDTVYDTATHLTWQRQVAGSAYPWSSSAEAGSAQAYCQGLSLGGTPEGWRLPTMKELVSIVDVSTDTPAIDGAAFPSTPAAMFWTASPGAISTSLAWAVSFDDGSTSYFAVSNALNVRCVR